MAKKPRKESAHKLRPDAAETAYRTMLEATGQAPKTKPPGERPESEKNPDAVKRGAKGGRIGGEARAAKLTPDERAEIARDASSIRWSLKKRP
jgi:hypothetical protein